MWVNPKTGKQVVKKKLGCEGSHVSIPRLVKRIEGIALERGCQVKVPYVEPVESEEKVVPESEEKGEEVTEAKENGKVVGEAEVGVAEEATEGEVAKPVAKEDEEGAVEHKDDAANVSTLQTDDSTAQ